MKTTFQKDPKDKKIHFYLLNYKNVKQKIILKYRTKFNYQDQECKKLGKQTKLNILFTNII